MGRGALPLASGPSDLSDFSVGGGCKRSKLHYFCASSKHPIGNILPVSVIGVGIAIIGRPTGVDCRATPLRLLSDVVELFMAISNPRAVAVI